MFVYRLRGGYCARRIVAFSARKLSEVLFERQR
jgi:hypothetical protein